MIVEAHQIQKAAKEFYQALETIPNQIELLEKEIKLCDQETQDLLHLIEMSKFHASEGYKICRDLQITRKRRRAAKDELETLNQIVEKLKGNRPIQHNAVIVDNVIGRRTNTLESRRYTPRVRSDLVERFNKCNKSKLLK